MTTASLQTTNPRKQEIERICLRLLAQREHSRRELINKLALKGYTTAEVEPVLTEISTRDWQNDQRFLQAFVRQRLAKGYGPLKIRYELQQHALSDAADLNELAEEYHGGWDQLLRQVYLHKFTDKPQLTAAEWLKRSRFLQQRGFSGEQIKTLYTDLKIKISNAPS